MEIRGDCPCLHHLPRQPQGLLPSRRGKPTRAERLADEYYVFPYYHAPVRRDGRYGDGQTDGSGFNHAPVRARPSGTATIMKVLIRKVVEQAKKHQPMQIHGMCASSCTMFLINPRACVHPDAELWFHVASYDYDPKVYKFKKTWKTVTPEMRSYARKYEKYLQSLYPLKIRKWIVAKGGLTMDWIILKGEEITRILPICKGPVREAEMRSHDEAVQRQALEEAQDHGGLGRRPPAQQ